MSTGNDAWRTPPAVLKALHRELRFTLDAAADAPNLLPRYWTETDDGAAQDWSGERVYCNPPYSRQGGQDRFLERAARCEADIAVLLVPVRTCKRAWHEHVMRAASEIRFVAGRIRFEDPVSGGAKSGATFPSVIVVFERGGRRGPLRCASWTRPGAADAGALDVGGLGRKDTT